MKLRRFQFSLRTLLIAITIVAALLGWWSYKAGKQSAAVEALRQHGAWIGYSDGSSANGVPKSPPRFVHWRYRVTKVDLSSHSISDDDIAALQALGGLKWVGCKDDADERRLRAAKIKCSVEVEPSK